MLIWDVIKELVDNPTYEYIGEVICIGRTFEKQIITIKVDNFWSIKYEVENYTNVDDTEPAGKSEGYGIPPIEYKLYRDIDFQIRVEEVGYAEAFAAGFKGRPISVKCDVDSKSIVIEDKTLSEMLHELSKYTSQEAYVIITNGTWYIKG